MTRNRSCATLAAVPVAFFVFVVAVAAIAQRWLGPGVVAVDAFARVCGKKK